MNIRLLSTPPHPCSYLPDEQSAALFVDPGTPLDNGIYQALIERGFRRSGEHLYRPRCAGCDACIPLRLPVERFRPSRGQRRTWRRNADLEVSCGPARFQEEQFRLYRDYLHARHRGGAMDDPTPESYLEFLTSSWSETVFYQFRLEGKLLAVAAADLLGDGLSAVYTFFHPDHQERSLGSYAILRLIHEARRLGLPWLYLGYWIAQCPKMAYKGRYRPHELYRNGGWQRGDHEAD